MYFAMDEIGADNVKLVLQTTNEYDRWKQIDQLTSRFGFTGIQFESKLYEKQLGLSLQTIPDIMKKYRLSYHIGGVYCLTLEEDQDYLEQELEQGLKLALQFGMEDVSLHPPNIFELSGEDERAASLSAFRSIMNYWADKYSQQGISLSLESHVHEQFWVFRGLEDYASFVAGIPGLGALVDISHLYNDGISVQQVITVLKKCQVNGLHLSDALMLEDYQSGTHLPVGQGEVDFKLLLAEYAHRDIYGVLEIKGSSRDIAASLHALKNLVK